MDLLKGFINKKHFWPRLIVTFLAVTVMGFCLSVLIRLEWGLDPCTLMTTSISGKIGMSLGNFQALLNIVLLVIVLFAGAKNIGFGTVFNMFWIGYSIDLFGYIWDKNLPVNFFRENNFKAAYFIPAIIIFIIAAALYMVTDMGTGPYDALPFMIGEYFPKINFRWIRMSYDFSVIVIGVAFGGQVKIATILMALFLGPVIGALGNWINKKWNFKEE